MSTSAAAAAGGGAQKTLDRINAQVAAGAFYEAQQMYKTVYHRYKARRATADATLVLRSGAVSQLAHNQVNCGMELATMLLEAFSEAKQPADADALGAVQDILQALPEQPPAQDSSSTSELDETGRWVSTALKWAHKAGAPDADVQRIHDAYAGWVWRVFGWKQLVRAALHFSRGGDAASYAAVLCDAARQSAPDGADADLFVTRAVLQALACAHPATRDRQLAHAAAVLEACKAEQPGLGAAPLIHFCGLLLQALSLRKHALLTLLQGSYRASLDVDPSFEAFLSSIEATWFDVQPAGGGGGLLGGLLKSMMEGDEYGDE